MQRIVCSLLRRRNMNRKQLLLDEISHFSLPVYREIPNVGLFLEQVTKYVNEYMEPLESVSLTGSMISNYVKKHIIKNTVRKQYDREQIAAIIFISMAKTVLSLEDIQLVLQMAEGQSQENVYESFRREMMDTLHAVFDGDETAGSESAEENEAHQMMKHTVSTIAHKIYLDKYFKSVRTPSE